MRVTTFTLIALLVVVTTVSSLKYKMQLPAKVISLHQHCKNKRGFVGECWNLNRIGNNPHCHSVACAASTSRGNKYPAYFFENAPDGLKCDLHKVCYQGICQDLPQDSSMPGQTTTSFEDYRECYVVGGTITRRT